MTELRFKTIELPGLDLPAEAENPLPFFRDKQVNVQAPLPRELLFNNPIYQPANLALRNAWLAGGIEWNVGQFGHSFLTCSH